MLYYFDPTTLSLKVVYPRTDKYYSEQVIGLASRLYSDQKPVLLEMRLYHFSNSMEIPLANHDKFITTKICQYATAVLPCCAQTLVAIC